MTIRLPRKNKRIRALIHKHLLNEGEPLSTHEIHAFCKRKTRHGITINALGNILAKDPRFRRCSMLTVGREISGGSYRIATREAALDLHLQPIP